MINAIEDTLKINKQTLGVSDADLDEVRQLVGGTSVKLLLVTFLASAMHLLFEILAFHSDIEFWQSNKSLVGLSVRSLIAELVSQIVVFLYLIDADTSLLVTLPAFIGIIIHIWKVWRATGISMVFRKQDGWIPRLVCTRWEQEGHQPAEALLLNADNTAMSRNAESTPNIASKSETLPLSSLGNNQHNLALISQEADQLASSYMVSLFLPVIIGYSIWSLVFQPHYTWYSWFINTLTACVYAFGFVFMFPQLYINHKLQSVSYLPWKVLVFRFFNTFIDDLFAFIIKMPTMHRLSVFRDDIIFIIYLWQRWKYRVDIDRPVEK